jgi:uncharacterized protein YuzB (UPF0349 family)
MNKEYCIFKKLDGSFVFTSSTKPQNYIDDEEFEVIHHDILDRGYNYSLVNGEIIRGEAWPEITE